MEDNCAKTIDIRHKSLVCSHLYLIKIDNFERNFLVPYAKNGEINTCEKGGKKGASFFGDVTRQAPQKSAVDQLIILCSSAFCSACLAGSEGAHS